MEIKCMVLGGLANNTYIIIGSEGRKAVIVDPAAEPERILDYLEGRNLELAAVLITHGHYDHIGALGAVLKDRQVPVYAHEEEARLMADPIRNLSTYFTSREITASASHMVKEGDTLDFGEGLRFETIVIPGHSPKGVCYYNKEEKLLITGDTLFAGSIGRTDYYNGDQSDLVGNIREKLAVLPNETRIYPGHGQSSTIGNEKDYNLYLR